MTTDFEQIQADNDQRKEEFVKQRQGETEDAEKALELAARKIVDKVMSKSSLYSQSDLENDLAKIAKSIAAKDIIDRLLDHMKCPMLTKPNWDFCIGCKKGEEKWCNSIDFLVCPAFSQYRAHELVEAPRRKARGNRGDKEKVPKKKV